MNSLQKSKHFPWIFSWDDAPIDISFIFKDEKPAGKHGFVTVKNNNFIFSNGLEVRFWGTCFNSAANFPEHAHAEKVARRLAKFGVNIVRLHQMDAPWSTPNIFQFTTGELKNNTLKFDSDSLDRLDYLIFALKQQGIYIYLDLLTYRKFMPGDGVIAADDLGYAAKPYSNFDRLLIDLQKKFAYNILTHINPYTGLAYKDDPVIALMEITNENDFFGWAKVTKEPYRSHLEEMFKQWASENNIDLVKEKIDFTIPTPAILRFFHKIQIDYYQEMLSYLKEIGVRVPITGSNWSMGLELTSALSVTDYTDSHAYWDMWTFDQGSNKPLLGEQFSFAESLSVNRLLDKPFFVSEWDAVWPNEWRADSTLYISALASLQEWNGLTIHTYRYRNCGPRDCLGGVIMAGVGYRANFDTFNDPAKFGLFYHAALMFRRRDIRPAEKTIGIKIEEHHMFKEPKEKIYALELHGEKHKIGIVLPDQKIKTEFVLTPDAISSDRVKGEIKSDTGEICRNWGKKIAWIDSPRTKCLLGFLADQGDITIKGLTAKVHTPYATLSFSSLTNNPINESENILFTAVGRADNTEAKYNKKHTIRMSLGHGPTLLECIEAEISLSTKLIGLKVFSIDNEGFFTGEVPSEIENGELKFKIGQIFPSMYYLIQQISLKN